MYQSSQLFPHIHHIIIIIIIISLSYTKNNHKPTLLTKLTTSYKLELSTRPEKALGDIAIWNEAEASLAEAMDEFAGQGNWRVNKGDGAFYGPKIDIKVMDGMQRVHQCATVQLDFQLPIRFDLKYKTAQDAGSGQEQFEKPIIVHRYI
jgi:threonyl-tRNA synthetase